MATYLVTGGAGFIGSHLVHELVARGEDVRVLDNFSTGKRGNIEAVRDRIMVHDADVSELEKIRPLFGGVDYVVHLAALASVARSVEDPVGTDAVNLGGTLHVLVASRDAGVKRLVFAASAAAYGNNPTLPRHESHAPDPLSPYALTKLAGEYYCRIFTRLYHLEAVALRFFNIFGPRQDPESPYTGVLSKFITAYLRGSRPVIFGDGEQSRDFTYVANVVEAVLLACHAPDAPGATINVGTGESYTLNQTITVLNRIFGHEVTPLYDPPRPGDVLESRADISLARHVLGYEPTVPFEPGLRQTVDWYRKKMMNDER
jgi:nucleoside-diphosphate-sugar epimerase